MRQIVLGIITVAMFTVLLTVFVVGLAFYQDYSTKKYVNRYYDDLANNDYIGACQHLHLFRGDPDKPLNVSSEKAKGLYLKKAARLKSHGYRVLKVNDIVVTEDNAHLGARVRITVEEYGKRKQVNESLIFYSAKIVVTDSQDPLAHLRDGQLTD